VITRLGMAARAASLSYDAFHIHWATSHGDATLALPGLRGYIQMPAVLDAGAPVLSEWGYDAISQLDFDDVAAMDAAFTSEAYATTVKGDEAKFIDKTVFQYGVYTRSIVRAGELECALALGDAGEIIHDGPHQRLDAVSDRPAPFARVDLLGCPDLEQALALAARYPRSRRHITRPNAVC
jgi:uncharacterized protein (TIGR02118 family)